MVIVLHNSVSRKDPCILPTTIKFWETLRETFTHSTDSTFLKLNVGVYQSAYEDNLQNST